MMRRLAMALTLMTTAAVGQKVGPHQCAVIGDKTTFFPCPHKLGKYAQKHHRPTKSSGNPKLDERRRNKISFRIAQESAHPAEQAK